ncbi:MAG TPA: ABC transporter transmembrane domain-containing protein [Polyangiaceae bacterium]|nr:ABC transporter transmembrane domain-containing protein [Polyangiaceae bacterium]
MSNAVAVFPGAHSSSDAVVALWRLMRARRIDVTKQQLREACGGVVSASGFADELRTRGCPARVVRLREQSDLAHLELPTLVMLRDSGAALVEQVKHDRVLLRFSDGGRKKVRFAEFSEITSGEALDLSEGLPSRTGYLRRLVAALGAHPVPLVQIAVVTLLMHVANAGLPLLLRTAVDDALPNGAGNTLRLAAIAMLAVAASHAWLGWFRERALQFLNARGVSALARGILEHLVHLPLAYFQKTSLGNSLQAMAAGEQIARLVTDLALVPFVDGALSVVNFGVLFLLSPTAGAIVLAANIVLLFVAVVLGKREATLQAEELAAQAKQNGYLVELLSAAPTLKAAGAEMRAVRRWRELLASERWPSLRRQRVRLGVELTAEWLGHSVVALLLVWGGKQSLDGHLSIGTLVAVLQLGRTLGETNYRLAEVCVKIWIAKPHSAILRELLQHTPTAALRSGAGARSSAGDAIVLHDVWFRHGPELPWVVQGFHLRIGRGEHYKLTGPSGSGKTTLLRLIAGLYQPERGAVMVHGVDAMASRRSVAYVPQDSYLFQGSILDNMRVLSGSASRESLMKAAKLTGLEAFVNTLPMSYETLLPPGGTNLSGGQRQLIVLTACVASSRPVLVLDEAMSQLDRLTQAALLKAALFSGKTVVSVVHEPDGASASTVVTLDARDESRPTDAGE